MKANRLAPVRRVQDIERKVEQSASAFVMSVHATRETSHELAPVRAANAGLIPAWQDWTRAIEERDGRRHPELRLSNQRHHSPARAARAAIDLVNEALHVHDASLHARLTISQIHRAALVCAYAALYQTRPHAVIEPTDGLQTWLAHTEIGDDVPAVLVQLPFPAVFVRFGPEMARAVDDTLWSDAPLPVETTGVYVFETVGEGYRDLFFTAIGVLQGHREEQLRGLSVRFTDETKPLLSEVKALEQEFSEVDPGLSASSSVAMVKMCIKVLLYLQTAGAVRVEDLRTHETSAQVTRVDGKKASRIERRLASRYNRIIVGPAQLAPQVIHHTPGEMPPHWRAGHMRMQAHGPQHSFRKLIFIAPTLIRADRFAGPQQ